MKGYMTTRAARVSSALLLLIPGAMSAQAKKCDINDGSPYQINGAKQYVIAAAAARKADEVPKHLSNAIKVLTDSPEKINNELGRQFLLMRVYTGWLKRDNAAYVMKRGDMGFTANPNGTQNVLLAIDSAVTAVERMSPDCASTVRPYRDQFSSEIYNRSIQAMNADQNDSSIYYARLALQLSSTDPRPWNILSAVYQKQNKMDSALIAMEKVISLAGSDTIYKKVKQQSRYNLAVITLTNAEAAKGAEKDQGIAKARALLEAYLKDSPGEASATQALGRAMRLSGDTASIASVFADMLKAPDKYTADQLFEAGSNAASSGRDRDAMSLFQSGFKKNPNHRTALLNFANVSLQLKDAESMGPAVQKLVGIDPNFDRGWRLMAAYWQLRGRAETDAAKKKAFGDSTVHYLDLQAKTNPRVDITNAISNGKTYQVQGTLSNDGKAAASYTIKLELLDVAGAVVGTKDVAVGPVDPGSNANFSVTIDSPKAVAFRYAKIQ